MSRFEFEEIEKGFVDGVIRVDRDQFSVEIHKGHHDGFHAQFHLAYNGHPNIITPTPIGYGRITADVPGEVTPWQMFVEIAKGRGMYNETLFAVTYVEIFKWGLIRRHDISHLTVTGMDEAVRWNSTLWDIDQVAAQMKSGLLKPSEEHAH